MKKFFLSLFLIAIGIFGTLGYQTYFPCNEEATCTSDSTKVDSVLVPEVSPATTQDTAKADSVK